MLPTENQRELADSLGRAKIEADLANNDARAKSLGEVGAQSVAAYEASLPDDGGDAAVVDQPADVERFGASLFTWNGGSNFTDNPEVRVERQVGSGWEPYADQSGELPVTLAFPNGTTDTASYEQGGQHWKWTAHFEAFVSPFDTGERPLATPAGAYRFVVDGQRREEASGGAVPPRVGRVPGAAVERDHGRGRARGRRRPGVVPRRAAALVSGDRRRPRPERAEIGPIDYPDSYSSPAPFIKDERTAIRDPAAPGDPSKLEWYCFTCSFRPWIDSGDASSAVVTDRAHERVARAGAGGRAGRALGHVGGDRAVRLRVRRFRLRAGQVRRLQRRGVGCRGRRRGCARVGPQRRLCGVRCAAVGPRPGGRSGGDGGSGRVRRVGDRRRLGRLGRRRPASDQAVGGSSALPRPDRAALDTADAQPAPPARRVS